MTKPSIKTILARVLSSVFKRLHGRWQWQVLWLLHSKFVVGVTGVVTSASQDHVLLLKHRYWKGEPWGLPSGYVEKGETWQDAFAREVYEESGLRIQDVRVMKVNTGFKLRVEVVLSATVSGPMDVKLQSSEILAAEFVDVSDLDLSRLRDSQREAVRLALNGYETSDIASSPEAR